MELLELPSELLTLILLSILRDTHDAVTLNTLRLVNRRLLSIAQPLTARYLCIEGSFGSYRRGAPILPLSREKAFLNIFSDDARAAAVRHLKVTGHVENSGIELLARLQNVTHLEISGAWMEEEDGGECFSMVSGLVGSFPALQSLHLIDCYQEDENFDEFRDDAQDDPTEYTGRNAYTPEGVISNSLRHIVCDNVDPAFRKLWLSTPTIEVVETHMCQLKPWDSWFRQIGVHRMLLRDPIFCARVKRLHVEYRLVADDDEEIDDLDDEEPIRDAENISRFFEWRARVLPCLQELILELPFQLQHLQEIVVALPEICPQLKRLKFEMSRQGYRDFLNTEAPFQPNGEFQSLEEIRLPFTGLNHDLVTTMPCIFMNSPRLAHIYLANPGIVDGDEVPSQATLLACTERYATSIHTLRSVSWDRHATVKIIKAEFDTQFKVHAFQRLWWEKRRGIAEWRE
ncbi:hypothetical protein B0H19DRAFT_1198511 [Mycena capillaripes]|nr:hypothetical protein B0H19DRAFT_1198511 [Mycena capillaripes]